MNGQGCCSKSVRSSDYPCQNIPTMYGVQRCGFLPLVVSTSLLIGMLLPYIIAKSNDAMPAFLPFVSHSGGIPPMCGLLIIPFTFLAFFGFILFPLLYKSIEHRNIYNSNKIRKANVLFLSTTLITCLSCVVAVLHPEGFPAVLPNKFEYIATVLLPHVLWTSAGVASLLCFQLSGAWIWWFLPDATRTAKYVKLVISIACVSLSLIIIKPLVDYAWEIVGPEPFNIQLMRNSTYDFPPMATIDYQIVSAYEWALFFLAAVNICFLYKDCQRISFRVALMHKSCVREINESSTIELQQFP